MVKRDEQLVLGAVFNTQMVNLGKSGMADYWVYRTGLLPLA